MNEALPLKESLWTVAEVAEYLRVSVSWVYLHAGASDLPCLRVGGLKRFHPAAVRAYARGERLTETPVLPLRRKV
jgi:excisionase family DNA binding protein